MAACRSMKMVERNASPMSAQHPVRLASSLGGSSMNQEAGQAKRGAQQRCGPAMMGSWHSHQRYGTIRRQGTQCAARQPTRGQAKGV